MPNAIIVGAGLSGLSAAFRLKKAGFNVTVLEASDRPGGRARTESRDGFVIDTGPDAMSESYIEYLSLLHEIGLTNAIVHSSSVVGLVRDQRVIDIDRENLLGAAFTPALSFGAKMKVAAGALKLRRDIARVDSFSLASFSEFDDPNLTAATFAQKHFGAEAVDYLIDPLMRLTVGTGASGASALNVLGALSSWASSLVNVEGGLDRLPRALANDLNVVYGANVQHVESVDDRVQVHWSDAAGEKHTADSNACVLACMLHEAREIWPPLRDTSQTFTDALTDLSLVSVSLAYKALSPSKAYVIQSPTCELEDTLLIFQQHHKAPDRAPPGHSLITLYTDGRSTPFFIGKSDDALSEWGRSIIERLFPQLSKSHLFSHVTRWPHAGYMATPGYWCRSKALMEKLPVNCGVWMAGDLFGAGSMESAVKRGRIVAEEIAHVMSGKSTSYL